MVSPIVLKNQVLYFFLAEKLRLYWLKLELILLIISFKI